MSTIANAKVEHNYNRYNGYFFGCLLSSDAYFYFFPLRYKIFIILTIN